MNTPCLWVNNQGKRFMNEDLLKDTVEYSSAVLAQGGYAYTIVDQATVDRWADASYENTGSWIHYWIRTASSARTASAPSTMPRSIRTRSCATSRP